MTKKEMCPSGVAQKTDLAARSLQVRGQISLQKLLQVIQKNPVSKKGEKKRGNVVFIGLTDKGSQTSVVFSKIKLTFKIGWQELIPYLKQGSCER